MRRHEYDESDVKIRSGRGSRPRTKTRPEHADAVPAMVVTVDRGRWGCVLDGDPDRLVTAMRARERGRTPIVVGDQVDVVGDLSGRPDTLARIVRRGERRTVLRRTADDTDPTERVVVANADQLLVVVALADPPPRTGLVDRTLIAAYAGGIRPILCLTKTDLAPAEPFAEQFAGLDLTVISAGRDDPRSMDRLFGTLLLLFGLFQLSFNVLLAGTHERYLALADQLAQRYGVQAATDGAKPRPCCCGH